MGVASILVPRCCKVGIKTERSGTSLVIQWLRLQTSNARVMGSIPDWGSKIPHAMRHRQTNKQKGLGGEGEVQSSLPPVSTRMFTPVSCYIFNSQRDRVWEQPQSHSDLRENWASPQAPFHVPSTLCPLSSSPLTTV